MDGIPVAECQITVAHILSALSCALDMVEGQPQGHAARTAFLALKLADRLGMNEGERNKLIYTSLLKDAGCSNNSARIHSIFGGDDLITKRRVKLIDWANPLESVKFAIQNIERDGTPIQRLKKMVAAIGPPDAVMNELTKARCTRGSQIALGLGFGKEVADAIYQVDEHWNGRGAAEQLQGDQISLLARIVTLCQTVEVFAAAFPPATACEMVKHRSGKWFQPELAQMLLDLEKDDELWAIMRRHSLGEPVELWDEAEFRLAAPSDIDAICAAFAEVIDAKSEFTSSHSKRVAQYAMQIGRQLNLSAEKMQVLQRAALLHDIGKLGVPNSILDKPGKLTDAEFAAVKLHPKFSFEILEKISGFDDIANIASGHHERLDGRGYWRGISGDEIDLETRIVTVADIFDALSAERPYRSAMPLERVYEILDSEVGGGIDGTCVEALKASGSPSIFYAA